MDFYDLFFKVIFCGKLRAAALLKRSRNQPAAAVQPFKKKMWVEMSWCSRERTSESPRRSPEVVMRSFTWPEAIGVRYIAKETPCRQFSVLVITKLIVGKRVRKFSLLHIHMLWKDSMTCKKSHPPSFILFYACMLWTRLFLNRDLGIFEMNQP